ncbi:nitroreductase family protein [Streptomyces nitrosporeus]|uniref:nitroreductase family protein n=1 Tax=Streptomyces nitrosporeus TaxID=28894 RepID=UPI0039A07DA3
MPEVQGNALTTAARTPAEGGSPDFAAGMWARMALSPAPREAPAEPVEAPGLRLALSLLEEGVLTGGTGRGPGTKAVPSAGAVYPYGFAVITAERGAPALFRIDGDRRSCARLATGPRIPKALAASGLEAPADGGAVIVTLTRPWLSMRKYGDRGYLYTQIDAGHAVGNLLLASAGRGAEALLSLRFPREPLSGLLEASGNYREVHSAVLVPAAAAGELRGSWTVHDESDRSLAAPTWQSWLEAACWESLSARPDRPAPPRLPGAPAPLAGLRTGLPLSGGTDGLGAPDGWPALLAARSSSKAFAPGTVPAAAIRQAVAALTTPVGTDLPASSPLAATLVVRSAAEPEYNGVHPLTRHGKQSAGTPSAEDVAQACMRQRPLAEAAAALLLHAPRTALGGPRRRPDDGAGNLRELAFRCGALGQLLYLGAARSGTGVTGVGGFDSALWRSLAGLPQTEEILYVLLLGRPDESGAKLDRLSTAHAQNER